MPFDGKIFDAFEIDPAQRKTTSMSSSLFCKNTKLVQFVLTEGEILWTILSSLGSCVRLEVGANVAEGCVMFLLWRKMKWWMGVDGKDECILRPIVTLLNLENHHERKHNSRFEKASLLDQKSWWNYTELWFCLFALRPAMKQSIKRRSISLFLFQGK